MSLNKEFITYAKKLHDGINICPTVFSNQQTVIKAYVSSVAQFVKNVEEIMASYKNMATIGAKLHTFHNCFVEGSGFAHYTLDSSYNIEKMTLDPLASIASHINKNCRKIEESYESSKEIIKNIVKEYGLENKQKSTYVDKFNREVEKSNTNDPHILKKRSALLQNFLSYKESVYKEILLVEQKFINSFNQMFIECNDLMNHLIVEKMTESVILVNDFYKRTEGEDLRVDAVDYIENIKASTIGATDDHLYLE